MTAVPYPLAWPKDVERVPISKRTESKFKTTLSGALGNVKTSLVRFGNDSGIAVTNVVLSSNVGGLDAGKPQDPGVAAWFTWDGDERCIAVDRYLKVEENLQAIHHIIEARRTEMRHGGLNITRQTFKAFAALPAPVGGWRGVMGYRPDQTLAWSMVDEDYTRLAKEWHPDKPGGDKAKMAALNVAFAEAKKEFGR